MVDLVTRPDRVKDTIDRWFDKEDFSNEQNEDLELDLLAERYEKSKIAKSGKNLLCLFLLFKYNFLRMRFAYVCIYTHMHFDIYIRFCLVKE